MMRELSVKLIVQQIYRDTLVYGGRLAPTFTYTTQALAPHQSEINSLSDFERFVTWQEGIMRGVSGTRIQFRLFVWKYHLDRAFDVLREPNVPLSYAWHPKQAWWRDKRYIKPRALPHS